jgi:hypothetical protein
MQGGSISSGQQQQLRRGRTRQLRLSGWKYLSLSLYKKIYLKCACAISYPPKKQYATNHINGPGNPALVLTDFGGGERVSRRRPQSEIVLLRFVVVVRRPDSFTRVQNLSRALSTDYRHCLTRNLQRTDVFSLAADLMWLQKEIW